MWVLSLMHHEYIALGLGLEEVLAIHILKNT